MQSCPGMHLFAPELDLLGRNVATKLCQLVGCWAARPVWSYVELWLSLLKPNRCFVNQKPTRAVSISFIVLVQVSLHILSGILTEKRTNMFSSICFFSGHMLCRYCEEKSFRYFTCWLHGVVLSSISFLHDLTLDTPALGFLHNISKKKKDWSLTIISFCDNLPITWKIAKTVLKEVFISLDWFIVCMSRLQFPCHLTL